MTKVARIFTKCVQLANERFSNRLKSLQKLEELTKPLYRMGSVDELAATFD